MAVKGTKRSEESKRLQSERMKASWAKRKDAKAKPDPPKEHTWAPKKDGPADPTPKGSYTPPKPASDRADEKPSDAQLVSVLGKLASLPAVPAKMVLDCDYCAMHFAVEGPKAAVELVDLAKHNPPLRGALEDVYRAYTKVTWIGIIAGYLAKPLAHHLAPNPFLEMAEPVLGVPPRVDKAANGTDPMAQAYAAAEAMVENMTEDEALRMAAQMGIDIDPSAMMDVNGADPTAETPGVSGLEPDADALSGLDDA